ncbi:MAG: hypothetical protein NVS4B1_24260 [Ktedonobacteraceae bacterium]
MCFIAHTFLALSIPYAKVFRYSFAQNLGYANGILVHLICGFGCKTGVEKVMMCGGRSFYMDGNGK